jgi:hypothetical protein
MIADFQTLSLTYIPHMKTHNLRVPLSQDFLHCLMGPNSLKCTKIFSQCHCFLFFLPSLFLPCKDTFMDDYDRI